MRVRRRTRVRLEFVATAPLHVGAGEGRLGPDQILATDAAGRHVVPGTSLAGALRQRLHTLLPDQVEEVFGYVRRGDDRAHASRIAVADAQVTLPDGVAPQVVTSVAIDRISGTAADRYLHDRLVLPTGTRLRTELVVDDTDLGDTGHGTVANILLRLLAGIRRAGSGRDAGTPLWLGAGTSRGLGSVTLDADASSYEVLALDSPSVLDSLYGDAVTHPLTPLLAQVEPLASRELLRIAVSFTPRGPLMLRGEHPSVYEAVPRFAWDGERYALSLPGTSLKGVLRQAAERIVATLTDADVADPVALDDPRALLDQHDQPLVDELFGTVKRSGGGRRGAIHISDLYATSEAHRLTADGLGQLLAGGTADGFDVGMHVALDRFTGGAAEHLLFDVLEPHGASWPPIEIEVDLARLGDGVTDTTGSSGPWAAVGLLLLVIGELQAGMHGIGAFAERGHGDIAVTGVRVAFDGPGPTAGGPDDASPLPPSGWEITDGVWSAAANGWTDWARSFVDMGS